MVRRDPAIGNASKTNSHNSSSEYSIVQVSNELFVKHQSTGNSRCLISNNLTKHVFNW